MKVVLLKDVKGSGKRDDIISVSDGYARNFLFPRRLAAPADAAAVNAMSIQKSAAQHRKFTAGLKAREDAKIIEKLTVTIPVRIGENGKMFGAVSGKEISVALQEQHGIEVDKKKIAIDQIRQTGEYTAKISLFEDVKADLKVIVKEAQ